MQRKYISKSYFYLLFKTLKHQEGENEVLAFKKFLNSYYRSDSPQVKMFNFLWKQMQKYPDRDWEKLQIFNKVFKEQASNTAKIRKVNDTLSDLYLALSDFLIYMEIKKKSFERNLLLAKILADRSSKRLFEKQFNLAYKILEEKEKSDEGWKNWQKFQLNHTAYFSNFYKHSKKDFPLIKEQLKTIDAFSSHLKQVYSSELNLLCPEKTYDNIVEVSNNLSIKEDLFYNSWKLANNPELSAFKEIKQQLKDKITSLSPEFAQNILTQITIAITKLPIQTKQKLTEIYNCFVLLQEYDLISLAQINDNFIINLVCHLGYQGKKDLSMQFIKEYLHLNPDKNDLEKLLEGIHIFFQKNFEDSLTSFQCFKTQNEFLLYVRYGFELYAYAQINEAWYKDKFHYLNKYIQKNKILQKKHKMLLKALYETLCIYKQDGYSSPAFKAAVKQTENLPFQDWLLDDL